VVTRPDLEYNVWNFDVKALGTLKSCLPFKGDVIISSLKKAINTNPGIC
jgi:hypothetical protein